MIQPALEESIIHVQQPFERDQAGNAALANLGHTTQLAALGVCLALGVPGLYLWIALASGVLLVPLQLRRERLARRA